MKIRVGLRMRDMPVGGRASVEQATSADMVTDADVWSRCSKEAMSKYGYDIQEQSGLMATFLSRRLKAITNPEEVAKRICALCLEKPASVERDEKNNVGVLAAVVRTIPLHCGQAGSRNRHFGHG